MARRLALSQHTHLTHRVSDGESSVSDRRCPLSLGLFTVKLRVYQWGKCSLPVDGQWQKTVIQIGCGENDEVISRERWKRDKSLIE